MDKNTRDNLLEKTKEFLKYETEKVITWCSNCGNYGIQNSVIKALVLEGYSPKDVAMCFDIGCCGNGSDKVNCYTIHGLHGRVLSLAAGASVANTKMKVIGFGGDGGTFSEGVNHLVHAVRNDYPFLFVHHNNENYGLTVGQASSTTRIGAKMNGTPDGVAVDPINTLQFVLSLKPSFVARGFSGDVDQMTEIFREALKHDGFAFVEILQACPTYNKMTPDSWYAERVRKVEDLGNYDNTDIWAARKLVEDMDKEIYTGILYRDKNKKPFLSLQQSRQGKNTELVDEVEAFDVGELLG
jgi:2-oxoglutarate/2-oxoacid ferredoxin oxidoreductase subunit beta